MPEMGGPHWNKLNEAKTRAVDELRAEEKADQGIDPIDVLERAEFLNFCLFGQYFDFESLMFFCDRQDLGGTAPINDATDSPLPLVAFLAPEYLAAVTGEELVRDLKEYARRACRHEEQRLSSD